MFVIVDPRTAAVDPRTAAVHTDRSFVQVKEAQVVHFSHVLGSFVTYRDPVYCTL